MCSVSIDGEKSVQFLWIRTGVDLLKSSEALSTTSVLWRCWLGGRKGIRPVKNEWWGTGMVVWSEMQTCIWPSWCYCQSLSLASVKSRLVLPFWYQLTRVVPEKGPLNVCVKHCQQGKVIIKLMYFEHNRSDKNTQKTSNWNHSCFILCNKSNKIVTFWQFTHYTQVSCSSVLVSSWTVCCVQSLYIEKLWTAESKPGKLHWQIKIAY